MRRSVSWCAQSRDSKATFNNNLMQTWHYTFGPHAPQTQVLCGFLNRPTAATVEDGFDDFDVEMRQNFCKRLRKFWSLISAVGEQRLQKWKHPEQCRHDEDAAIAILNVGRMNDGVEQ